MTVKIKPKRGSGSPAGSIETNEIAMDTSAKKLYVSTTGSDAVVLADNTENFLETNTTELDITSDIDLNNKQLKNIDKVEFSDSSTNNEIIYNGNQGSAFNFQSLKISSKFNPSLSPDLSGSNGTFQISNFKDSANNFLNRLELQTANRKAFFGVFVTDTGTGDDGSHKTTFTLKGADSASVFNQLQSFTSASATPAATRLDITGSKVSFYDDAYRLPTSDGSADQFLKTDGSGNLSFAAADDTKTYLDTVNLIDYSGSTPIAMNLGSTQVGTGSSGQRMDLQGGTAGIRLESNTELNGAISLRSTGGNPLTLEPQDDQNLVIKQTTSSDTAQIDVSYNGSNQFTIDSDSTSNKRIAVKGDRASMLAPGSSDNSEVTVRSDRVVMGVDGTLYMTLRSDQVQLSKDLDMNGTNIVDANEIQGKSDTDLELKTTGTNNIKLTSTNDIDLAVGAVTTDNVNITGKTNITGDNSQPHTLKILTDMNDSSSDDLHNSMTFVLDGYLNSGNGIKDNVQNSVTFQVQSDTETKTVGRYSAEYQANGVGNRMKVISVNNGSAGNDGNAEGAIGSTSSDDPNGNGQVDVDCQRFKSNVPVLFPSYTTTERGTLHNIQNGMVIYNTTDHKLQVRANGSWVDLH